MLLYFLVKKDFRGIINAVISLLAFTAIGAVLAWENTKEFFSSTLLNLSAEGDSGVDTTFQSNSSIQAMLYRWWTSKADAEASSLPTILWIVLSLIAVAAVAYLMHQLFSRGLHVEAVMVNAMLMLLISPSHGLTTGCGYRCGLWCSSFDTASTALTRSSCCGAELS